MYARGPVGEVIDIGEQLCWLTATFRPPETGLPRYSTVRLFTHLFEINIAPDPLLSLQPSERKSLCWLPLFKQVNIARGFPRRSPCNGYRHGHEGVELPFQLMLALADVRYPLSYDTGTILRGPSTLLIPTAVSEHGVQWHLEATADGSDMSVQDVAKYLFESPTWHKTANLGELRSLRHFLGYCSNANVYAGTRDSGYATIRHSGAQEEATTMQLSSLQATLGSEGTGIFGGSLGVSLKFQKGLRHNLRDCPLDRELGRASNHPLLLYDTGTGRGWLVPEISALLQCVQSWQVRKNHLSIPFANIASDGGKSAEEAIITSKDDVVYTDRVTNNPVKFQEVVQSFMNRFNQLREQTVLHSLETHLIKRKNILLGWDYSDIAEEAWTMRRREWRLTHNSPWLKHVYDQPEILVLMCERPTSLIRPSLSTATCDSCREIPWNRSLVVATNRCAIQMGFKVSSDVNSFRSRNTGDMPFRACERHQKGLRYRIQTCIGTQNGRHPETSQLRECINGACILGDFSEARDVPAQCSNLFPNPSRASIGSSAHGTQSYCSTSSADFAANRLSFDDHTPNTSIENSPAPDLHMDVTANQNDATEESWAAGQCKLPMLTRAKTFCIPRIFRRGSL